jgi:phytoene dehydrogenase-like protein
VPEAIVIGAGPNGLTAAVTLARAGVDVLVYEAAGRIGGGARTDELTLPGFRHDVCSAVHPLGIGSPAFRSLPLEQHGLRWVHPEIPLAHPFPDGSAAVLVGSPAETAVSLGEDARTYRRLVEPFVGRWDELAAEVLRPPLMTWPRHPLLLARFGVRGALPLGALARRFRGERARGLLAGLAGHTITPLTSPASAGVALMFALAAHEAGWPVARGGSQAVSDALAALLAELGGRIETDRRVTSLDELPPARAYLLDTDAYQLADLAGSRLPTRFTRSLRRRRRGPGVFKLDYALAEPVPWTADAARRAGTVHLGPSMAEIGSALRAVRRGTAPDPPFLIAAQPSLADDTRAPNGRHVLWVYCHVPNGWAGDHTEAIEDQIERFAPGFRDIVLARSATGPAQLAARNPNLVGGDIGGGPSDGLHLIFRPTFSPVPYATPDPAVFLCSSATPPGPGVHGMCGYHAATLALRRVFGG